MDHLKLLEVAETVRNAKSVTVIIGAGASVRAGIPAGSGLIKMVREKYPRRMQNLNAEQLADYGKVMRQLSPSERQALIEPILQNAKTSWGQIALAGLMRQGFAQRVLTFNFDLVLEQAVSLTGGQFPVYDFAVAPTDQVDRLADSCIIHMHGQSFGMTLLNTDDETQAQAENLQPLLRNALESSVTLVLGYSGLSDKVFPILEASIPTHGHKFYWMGRGPLAPDHLADLLENPYAEYYGECDYDLFMIDLARELGCWPPQFQSNPMLHVLDSLTDVADYPVNSDHDESILTSLRHRLVDFGNRWDAEDGPNEEATDALLGINSDLASIDVTQLDTTGRTALLWAILRRARQLLESAKSSDEFEKIYELHEFALKLQVQKSAALNGMGIALATEGRKLAKEEAVVKFQLALDNYRKAVNENPRNYRAFNNACQALMHWANVAEETQKSKLREKALEKAKAGKAVSKKANFNLACCHALLGQAEEAIDELEQCTTDNTNMPLAHLKTDSDLDSLREMPRFQALLDRISEGDAK